MVDVTQYKIFISDIAIEKIKNQLGKRNNKEAYLRLGVRGGGCSGYSYALQFEDKEPSTKDLLFKINGVKVVVDIKSILYINNCTLEWEQTLMYQGFKFINPNEASKCGCGISFNVR